MASGSVSNPQRPRGRRPSGSAAHKFSLAGELAPGLLAWYQRHHRPLPWRQRWKASGDPYVVWVSEIMLQQTVIKAVIPVYHRFLERFPTVFSLAAADDASVREAVRGLGYYRRFRFMHAAAGRIAEAGGSWPQDFAGWKELPGIGDYTAAAIASIAFGDAAAVVDGNVERVFCRLLDLREPPNAPYLKRPFRELATALISRDHPGDFNQAMMELGQTVCLPSNPNCEACPIATGCMARARGSQALAPAPKLKGADPVQVPMTLVLLHRGSLVALVQRPKGARFLKGTLGLVTAIAPNGPLETEAAHPGAWAFDGWGEDATRSLARLLGRASKPAKGVHFRHSITHHRILGSLHRHELLDASSLPKELEEAVSWVPAAEVERRLIANLDRKAWRLAQPAFMEPDNPRRPSP